MKFSLILIVAAGLVAACSQTEQRQTADAKQGAAATQPQPASNAAAPPATATTQQPATAAQDLPAPRAEAPPNRSSAEAPAPTSAPPSAAAAAPPPAAAEPPAPKFREVTIPAGTGLNVKVLSTLASNKSQIEDPVSGALAKAVVISGSTAVPEGAELSGTVTDAKESGRVKGRATIGFRFNRIVVRGETHTIQTARVIREAEHKKGDDVKKGGLGAGLGAVVGGIAGGGSGAAIGAVAGGTGTVLATKGREVEVPPGTVVTVLLQKPLTVQVPVK
jgi:hypothetical protein